ncbi:hypothetical protein FORC47_2551 [Bacillus cereus]|nr:hypothetical protein FORC47_2551 [Bacillus cereus]
MLHIKRKYQKPQLEDLGCGFFLLLRFQFTKFEARNVNLFR